MSGFRENFKNNDFGLKNDPFTPFWKSKSHFNHSLMPVIRLRDKFINTAFGSKHFLATNIR